MPSTGSAALLAALLSLPPSVERLPPLERGRGGFTGAIGRDIRAEWQVSPSAVADADTLVSLVVTGAANPAELDRPAVEFPAADFQVLDYAGPPRPLPERGVAFDTRLRPRRAGGVGLPAVAVVYYRPDRPPGKRFLTAYADPVTLAVTPPRATPPADTRPRRPLFPHPAADNAVPLWAVFLPLPLGLLAAACVNATVRRRNRRGAGPHPATVDAQRMLARPLNPSEVRAVVQGYLASRYAVPPHLRTAREVADRLPRSSRDRFVALLTRCEEAAFSADGVTAPELASDALAAVEADAA